MAFDYSSSFAGINNALANIGRQNELAHQRQTLASLGQQIKAGDYTGAAQSAFSVGDAGTAIGILGLGQKQQDRDAERQFFKSLGVGMGASPASTAGAGPTSLINSESGGNWQAQNDAVGAGGAAGHFGRAQFGQARLQDAANAGAIPQGTTPQQFMQSPELQKRAEAWHFGDIDNFIAANGYDKLIGQTINGVPITADGMRAVAHLGGTGGLRKFIESGGRYNPADRNGTTLMAYLERHQGSSGPAPQRAQIANPVAMPQPVQVAETEADVQRLEQEQAARGQTVQVAQAPVQPGAPIADAPNAPAPGAVEAQGFAIPGTDTVIPQSLMNDPQVQRFSRLLMVAPTERARAAVKGQLDLAIADAKQRMEGSKPTELQRNYELARRQGYQGSFFDYQKELRQAGAVNLPSNEKSYDQTVGKAYGEQFVALQKDGQNASKTLGTINMMERLMQTPGFYSGFGGERALAMNRALAGFGLKDMKATSAAEAFQALSNQTVLDAAGGSLGAQISNGDRDYINATAPNLANTPEGNKELLGMRRKLAERQQTIAKMARDYARGNKGRIDAGFDDIVAQYAEENPLFPQAQPQAPAGQPQPNAAPSPAAPVSGARQAPDGNWYVPDPSRPGKYLQVQ